MACLPMSSTPVRAVMEVKMKKEILTPERTSERPEPTPPGLSPFYEGAGQLFKALESHDVAAVRRLICLRCVDPNRLYHSMTLLHLAVGFSDNRPEIVRLLLQQGGQPNNTAIEERLSPTHLSVIYDYDKVLEVLIQRGGDPKVLTGDNKSCYEIAKDNLESEMLEKCFLYFYHRSMTFRKSIRPTDRRSMAVTKSLVLSSPDTFHTCESSEGSASNSDSSPEEPRLERTRGGVNRRLFDNNENNNKPESYSYLMTEDESEGPSAVDERLSTINEESTQSATATPVTQTPTLSYDSGSVTEVSCVNSTPPLLPDPTDKDLEELQEKVQKLGIPVTLSTFKVLNKFAKEESKLAAVLAPKSGTANFSSELQSCLQNLNLVLEWGNLKIELIQNFTPKTKSSKSFYNYLLLDPKVIKKANFSGNHLKSGVINNASKFETFLKSIFYIGKGCGKRPIQHLVDAKAKLRPTRRSNPNPNCGEKIDKILEIWKSGLGVIVVSVFHHSSEREANVNEAAMIDAVGLVELSNLKKGSYAGTVATTWSQKVKNQLGSFLLHKCYAAFAVGDHKSFNPIDV